jgi:hypothetical protein
MIDVQELDQYLNEIDNNTLTIEVLWDKYNAGLLCTKIFTLVDKYDLLADLKVISANSIELWISLASAAAGGVAGGVAKELVSYLIKRKKTHPRELPKTIIVINDHRINIDLLADVDTEPPQ